MDSKVMFSSKYNGWKTPIRVFRCLERIFGKFDLDPCTEDNHLNVPNFYTPKDNGLIQPWFGNVYVNPPYNEVYRWVRKAITEVKSGRATRVVMLIASRTDTRWFHDIVLPYASWIMFVRGRIRFDGAKNSAPFPSLVVVFESSSKKIIGSIDLRRCRYSYYLIALG